MAHPKGILIRKLTKEYKNEVLDFIAKYYNPEYFKKPFGLEGEDVIKYNQMRISMKLEHQTAFGAFVKETNQLVGVGFGGVIEKSNKEQTDFLKEGLKMSLDLQAFHNFFTELQSDVFDLLKTDRIFQVGTICVHKDYRRKGIDTALRKEINDLALQSGFRYLIATVFDEIRIQVFRRLGRGVLKEMKYHDYHDPEIKSTIFKNTKYPYVRAQIIYIHLQNSENRLKAKI